MQGTLGHAFDCLWAMLFSSQDVQGPRAPAGGIPAESYGLTASILVLRFDRQIVKLPFLEAA
ncbi:MAG: hypothetical protein ACYTBV_20305, partial [Planctomycetota bacterium]